MPLFFLIELILLCASATRHDVKSKSSGNMCVMTDGSEPRRQRSGSYGGHRDTAQEDGGFSTMRRLLRNILYAYMTSKGPGTLGLESVVVQTKQ
ncbi:hypothetical protein F5Y08DRAFT_301695 [Xylaria arbuscula]|nr:hypothetical protein F5Y08DRAFT_301695 [Xylaria arbuscula]